VQHDAQRAEPRFRLEREIDEAGAGDIDARHQRIGAKARGDGLGEVARLALASFASHHRRVGRHVAMGGVLRRLHDDAREVDALGQHALRAQRRADAAHAREHVGEQMRGWRRGGHRVGILWASSAWAGTGRLTQIRGRVKSRRCSMMA